MLLNVRMHPLVKNMLFSFVHDHKCRRILFAPTAYFSRFPNIFIDNLPGSQCSVGLLEDKRLVGMIPTALSCFSLLDEYRVVEVALLLPLLLLCLMYVSWLDVMNGVGASKAGSPVYSRYMKYDWCYFEFITFLQA